MLQTGRAALLLPLLLAGCGDPYEHLGTWKPTGVNDANLAVEVINKNDLFAGREAPGADGTLAAAAIQRLHGDKTKALHIEATSSMSSGGSNGASQ